MSAADKPMTITVLPGGWRFGAGVDQPLLAAAREARVIFPSSCRNGTCRACLCRVTNGVARHTVPWPGLSAEEKIEGYILPCVAVAETDLEVDVPRASVGA